MAYLWASPCSAVGLSLGAIAVWLGARWTRRAGVIEIAPDRRGPRPALRRLPFIAITFGHVVLGRSAEDLERLRDHEHAHVAQYERWGPLFFIAYPLASLAALLRGRRPYLDNAFEIEARAIAARRISGPDVRASRS